MTLKQIFKMENFTWVELHDILKRMLAKVSFDALFLRSSRFVAIRFTFND